MGKGHHKNSFYGYYIYQSSNDKGIKVDISKCSNNYNRMLYTMTNHILCWPIKEVIKQLSKPKIESDYGYSSLPLYTVCSHGFSYPNSKFENIKWIIPEINNS